MAKVKISSSINVPYSFKDNSGKEIKGSTDYAMLSDGFGLPKVIKCTAPVFQVLELELQELVYDYKQRLVTDKF